MKILVTGGAGYLGSVLVEELLADDHTVTVLDTFAHRENSLAHLCANPKLAIERGDARYHATLERLLAHADVILPLAAIVGAPACEADKTQAILVNYGAVEVLCALASRQQRIIIPITNSGYGIGTPGKECTEETPLKPISTYGQTKVMAERIVLSRENATSLRLATLFGMSPRMRLDLLVNDFVHRAVTDRAVVLFEPHFKRNYLHVRDAAFAFIHAIDLIESGEPGSIYNVGLSDANLSKLELCLKIQEHVPGFCIQMAEIGEDPDKRDYVVSNAKIEATGWKPVHSLDDGIDELIKGYRMLRNGRYGNE